VPVLVRPHPFNVDAWAHADFSDLGPVAIWPRERYTPAEESARNSFFDSLYHSAAIVGINTSAMVEGAILGKPVLSLLTPEFAGTQEGTLHFHYLLPENGGFLRVANTLEAHEAQLADALANPAAVRKQSERFVGGFLRPRGLATPCTPFLADAFESAASRRPAPRRESIATKLLRLIVFPLALVVSWAGDGSRKKSKKREAVDLSARVTRTLRETRKAVVRPLSSAAEATRSAGRVSWRRVSKGARSSRRAVVRWTRLARYGFATRVLGRGDAKSGDMRP